MTTQLNTLIRLRQYEVDRGQTQLAAVLQLEHELINRRTELDQQIALHRSQLSELSRHGQLNINAIRLRQQYLQLLTEQRVDLLAAEERAQLATRQHRERLIAADQRLQVAEKLRERVLRESQAQRERQESREHEEAWQVASRSTQSGST